MEIFFLAAFFLLFCFFVAILLYFRKTKQEISSNLSQAQTNYLNSFNSIFSELSKLYEKMGGLDKESKEIHELTKTFHHILMPTKKRGSLGESLAENLLREVLPADAVLSQYMFKDGKRVDFVVKLPGGLVPIDAKFSLETFKNYQEASQHDKKQKQKIFIDSIKKRISETAHYIYPDENTVDFSIMYVPSESVYYSIITETDLLSFSRSKKVFIAGPNTLYIYLRTLCIGFRALKIGKNTRQIYNTLERLDKDIDAFTKDYGILGTHIRSAAQKYQDLNQKITGVSQRLKTIENKDLE